MRVVKLIIGIYDGIDKLGSFLMKSFLRLNGANIGKNTYVSFSSRIVGVRGLNIGNDSVIKKNVKMKSRNIIVGHNTIISENSYISGNNNFTIGNKSYIGKNVRIDLSKDVKIGDDVGVAEGSKIFTHGFFPPADEGYPVTFAPVEIGDNSWISSNCIILPRVKIGKDVILGPGTVITKNVAENSIINGNPAKFIINASKIKRSQPFLKIMENIFGDSPDFKLKLKNDGLLEYNINDQKMLVFDSKGENSKKLIQQDDVIFIFKNIKDCERYREKKLMWIDLDKKEMTPIKTKEVQLIQKILRANGIRLLKIYK